MRHGISGNKLNRQTSHRKATVRDIAKATLQKQRICTTIAKAKEARKLVDKLITLSKAGALADKRRAFSILCDHKIVSELFTETAPRFKNRVGGYTRIIPLGTRRGDNAQLAYLELTEKKEIIISKAKSTASAKIGKITPVVQEAQEEKLGEKTKSSDESKKKEFQKQQTQKAQEPQDKSKSSKKFMGGIRKMFNRKQSGK